MSKRASSRHEYSQHRATRSDCQCWNYKAQTLKQACFQGYPKSTICVQVPVGSRNPAIHNAYRTSLRPSSLIEPRHPSLKVVKLRQKPLTKDCFPTAEWQMTAAGKRRQRRQRANLSPSLPTWPPVGSGMVVPEGARPHHRPQKYSQR